jgi:hypothetical protein
LRTWALTDGNHALAVIVKILLDNLKQALNGPPSPIVGRLGLALAEVLVLLLHLGKGGGEAADDTLVRDLVNVGVDEQAKVEDELVALVLGVGDDDGEAEDGILAVGGVDGDVAVAKGLARDDVLLEDVKVDERRAGATFGGGDAAGGRLRNDLWSFLGEEPGVEDALDHGVEGVGGAA